VGFGIGDVVLFFGGCVLIGLLFFLGLFGVLCFCCFLCVSGGFAVWVVLWYVLWWFVSSVVGFFVFFDGRCMAVDWSWAVCCLLGRCSGCVFGGYGGIRFFWVRAVLSVNFDRCLHGGVRCFFWGFAGFRFVVLVGRVFLLWRLVWVFFVSLRLCHRVLRVDCCWDLCFLWGVFVCFLVVVAKFVWCLFVLCLALRCG